MDSKLHTFLVLCQTMNYRLAAERLHLSQPAVTKQIQSLEQSLQTKLFNYDGHALHKTEKCLLLERYPPENSFAYPPHFKTTPYPPGPGLPLDAPSV